jgi:hypothetical protein
MNLTPVANEEYKVFFTIDLDSREVLASLQRPQKYIECKYFNECYVEGLFHKINKICIPKGELTVNFMQEDHSSKVARHFKVSKIMAN